MTKLLLAFLVLVHGTAMWAAEFTLNIHEASFEPRDGFIEHAYKANQKIYVGPDSGITSKHLANLAYQESNGEPILQVTFTADGAVVNQAFTKKMLKQPIAIFINQQLISIPVVRAPSRDQCWILGPSKIEIEQFVAAFSKR